MQNGKINFNRVERERGKCLKEIKMINRFEGAEGKRRLISALKECYLVEHDESLAAKLAEVGDLATFDEGDAVMTQGNDDNDIYFLLVGEVNVLINNRHIAIRKARETVGEMAIINPAEPRSATLLARTNVVALKVTEPDFHHLARNGYGSFAVQRH